MWERFSMTLPDTNEEASRSALMLLAMVATADVQVVTSNVNVLISVGLGERGSNDFRLAHLTCAALLKMAPTKVSSESQALPMRFPPTHKWHEIFERTSKLLVDGLIRLEEDTYYSQFATTAVSLIYTLGEHPDAILGEVLKKMCAIAYSRSQELSGSGESGEIEIAPGILTRILVIAGQIAIKQLIHLDVHVYTELRRRARVREEKQEASSKKRRNLAMSASRRGGPRAASMANDTADEDEIVGAVADDDEAEYVRKVKNFLLIHFIFIQQHIFIFF